MTATRYTFCMKTLKLKILLILGLLLYSWFADAAIVTTEIILP
ncbi:MAG: hypothetical protein ACOYXT_23110 [Bacteroidota bacterium]